MGTIRMIAVSATLAVGLVQAGAANAQDREVQIVRGGQSAGIVETREADVRVFRGSPATTTAPADHKLVGTQPVSKIVASGSKVWLVDQATGTLRVCQLVATTQVGERRIDCHVRGLPR